MATFLTYPEFARFQMEDAHEVRIQEGNNGARLSYLRVLFPSPPRRWRRTITLRCVRVHFVTACQAQCILYTVERRESIC